jgi:hypothetical protein
MGLSRPAVGLLHLYLYNERIMGEFESFEHMEGKNVVIFKALP